MNMIERFLSRVRSKTATSNAAYMAASSKIVMGDEGKRQPFSYASAVRSYSSWVYAAANLNAVAVASQPLRLYVRSRDGKKKLWKTRSVSARVKAFHAGDLDHLPSRHVIRKAAEYGENYEVVTENHPVLDLLEKVNPYQNGFDATVLRILYTELTGNAYLHPVVDKALGVPIELWTMPSQFVEIVPGKVDFIDGYLYGAERDKRRMFPAEEVIHFKRPNPNDLYYGIGKAEAAWGAIMSNDEIHSMDYHFFANKARPDWLMTIKGMVSTEEMDRLEKQIEEKLRGSKRAGRFLTASADIDIKPLSFPPKDLQGRIDIVEEIAAVFGVPVSMLKANDPNLASATIGFAAWKANTILPLLRMDEEVLNQNLLPMFNIEGDAFLSYDNPVLSDERFQFEKNRSSVAGGIMTVNEARTRNGLDASEDPAADRLLMGNQPLGGPTSDPSQPEALSIADPTTPAAEGEQISPIDQPTSVPVPGEAAPSGDAPAVAIDAPAAAALNGAQISSLIGLARSAALAELPIDSVRAIASAAFPSVSPQLIESIFSPITPQQQQDKPPAAAVPIVAKCAGEKASDPCTSEKIGKLLDEGYDREQAIAIAISMCDDGQTKSLEDIDTTPPQSVADNARRALEVRAEAPQSQRGMTAVGIARARDLQNRTPLSEETIRRMVAYFERHEVDKQGESWDEQGKGWQAWNGWGGDEGWSWSKRKRDEFDRARSSDVQTKDCGSGAGGFKPGNSCGGGGDGGSATAGVKPPSPSLSAPKKHDAAIPANPRRMTVDQFSAGLAAMGYTEVSTRTENPHSRLERQQFFTLRDAKGNESEAEMNDILSSMYASSSDPKLSKVKPVRRSKSASCGCGCESTRVVSHKNMWSHDSMVCKAARKPSASTAANEFDNITKDETAIGKAVDKILRKQIDAVMKKLNASIVPTPELTLEVEQMLMSSKWDRQLVEAMRPYLQRSLQQGITLGFETIKKLASSVPDFNPQTANLDAYVKSESVRLARGIARGVKQYTAVKVKTLLGEGIQAGETAQQLSSRVMEWAGEEKDAERSTRSRALTIARTEANRASRKAESEAWRSTGLVEGKTWLLAPDPCEFCEAASEMFGETSVGIDDAFFAQGEILKGADDNEMILDYEAIDGPPLHPNCRCSMQPRLIDDYEAVIKEMEAEAAAQDGPYEESQ